MRSSKYLVLAKKVLEEEKRPLTPGEIWEIAVQRGHDSIVGTQGRTPWSSLGAQLYVTVRDEPNGPFVKHGSRPCRFYLRTLAGNPTNLNINETKPATSDRQSGYKEAALHPLLTYFGFYYLQAYLKTIHHSKTSSIHYAEWLHPDMVGCYYPIGEWEPEVIELGAVTGNTAVKLFSFEIKKQLSFGNLRESFFQAVSNSSWANEGYLVAAEISDDEDFRSELKRLSSSFGIGVIRLDIKDLDSSAIVFPARTREYLDWDAMNKLAINPDFKEFLRRVKTDMTSREIRQEQYDAVMDKDILTQKLING